MKKNGMKVMAMIGSAGISILITAFWGSEGDTVIRLAQTVQQLPQQLQQLQQSRQLKQRQKKQQKKQQQKQRAQMQI